MSKVIDAMQIHSTGRRYAELGKLQVSKDECYKQYKHTELEEYRLEALLGVAMRCRPEEVKYMKEEAEHMVREEVFGEYRKVLRQIKYAAYNRDFKEVDNLVSSLECSMFGVGK